MPAPATVYLTKPATVVVHHDSHQKTHSQMENACEEKIQQSTTRLCASENPKNPKLKEKILLRPRKAHRENPSGRDVRQTRDSVITGRWRPVQLLSLRKDANATRSVVQRNALKNNLPGCIVDFSSNTTPSDSDSMRSSEGTSVDVASGETSPAVDSQNHGPSIDPSSISDTLCRSLCFDDIHQFRIWRYEGVDGEENIDENSVKTNEDNWTMYASFP
ncbi:hypothetical protein AB6A40_008703 [Gnathostoma spinigerum]|uniref:Uncharacterized protein n=1 Tax=Gnathostoma spinigerum TaxID=75299 RepID=A0ABD6EXK7_9BILA